MSDSSNALRRLNLNLLPILLELLKCASVTQAARRLCLTQSTVSGSLRQLRFLLNDELLVSQGRKMILTEKSKNILPELELIMAQTVDLFKNEKFDPAFSRKTFHVYVADYAAVLFPQLRQVLCDIAPGISIKVSGTPRGNSDHLRSGELDFLIFPDRSSNWKASGIDKYSPEFNKEILFQDYIVGIQCANRSFAGPRMTSEEFFTRPVATYFRTDGRATVMEEVLKESWSAEDIKYYVPYFSLLPELVINSNLIALVPHSLAIHYARFFPINVFELPIEFPPLDITIVTLSARKQKADLIWFCNLLRTL
ncbi:LysR family transcriptional regulator [Paraburkholderia aspalathi]|uniref:LysR family transcriptional regulator n=1 Tax=Paraburkholderia aspalathi TaxID=1324617 RepID=UPI001B09F358|nr:LysR family transcriptional regulator [Paraburkholderia aspalathi]CAE6841274.1 Nodulation protein D 2 [Paraburkholderia aspalathi]